MARISKIMIKQFPVMHLLSVRKTIDFMNEYADFMGSAIEAIQSCIEKQGAYPGSGPVVCFHNVDLEALDVEIGFRVAQPIEAAGMVQATVIPLQTVAITIDRGPYEQQDPTLEALMSWIPEHGYEAAGGIYYHYLNDEEQPESEYLTEMFIPVRKLNEG